MIKPARIIIHAMALLISIVLIMDMPFIQLSKQWLMLFLVAYSLINLFVYLIVDLLAYTIPRFIGISVVFFALVFQHYSQKLNIFDQNFYHFLIWFPALFSFFLLLNNVFGIQIMLKPVKSKITAFRKYYLVNFVLYIFLLTTFIIISYLVENGYNQIFIVRVTALLLILFPFLNKQFIKNLYHRFQARKDFAALKLEFGLFGKLGLIRNFVFMKDKIISTGKYQITESDYRSTIRVSTALALSRYLAEQWNPKYTSLFVRDEYEKLNIKFQVVEKNENGISVIDDDAIMYHFGNSSYLKNKTHKDDHSNLFLLKNDIPIAKFKVNEKIEPEKAEFFNELDYYGNVLLLNSGNFEDLGHDYTIIFDKIYSGISESKQIQILKDLEKKAPTAFFSSKQYKEVSNSVFFYITSKSDASPNARQIILTPQDLYKIPGLIHAAREFRSLLQLAMVFLIISQFGLAIIALFTYKYPVILCAIAMLVSFAGELIAAYIFRKVQIFPLQPANRAQSHQAA